MKHADIAFDTDLSFGSIEDNSSFELEDPTESRRYTATFGKFPKLTYLLKTLNK